MDVKICLMHWGEAGASPSARALEQSVKKGNQSGIVATTEAKE
jgi:hypothetical protein